MNTTTSFPIYTVDSFTDQAMKGNPAGVCVLQNSIASEEMLKIAQELNLSETAFIYPENDVFAIRYFSPVKEIPLCGHATLAASKILIEENGLSEARYMTKNQVSLRATKRANQIVMEFPSYSTIPFEPSPKLIEALGIDKLHDARYNVENNMVMLVTDEKELIHLKPDFEALLRSNDYISGVLVTASSNDDYDFKSRYFWPWSGGNEDPVTGATHTFMAPYWGNVLQKNTLKSFQASKRTGFMEIELERNGKIDIIGNAVVVIKGTLTL
ncbi:MAG: PhzF family phenazine biosynthesis protein [Ekhidna sp.]